jgi:hypothetical protein
MPSSNEKENTRKGKKGSSTHTRKMTWREMWKNLKAVKSGNQLGIKKPFDI